MEDEGSVEFLQLASLLLPFLEHSSTSLRWVGHVSLNGLVAQLAPFLLELMVRPPRGPSVVNDEAIAPALRRFRPPHTLVVGRMSDGYFRSLLRFSEECEARADEEEGAPAPVSEKVECIFDRAQRKCLEDADARKNTPTDREFGTASEIESVLICKRAAKGIFLSPREEKIRGLLMHALCPHERGVCTVAEGLQKRCEVVASAIFAAADEQGRETVTWDDVKVCIADSAIAYSAQLALRDAVVYVPTGRRSLGIRSCLFARPLSETKIVEVVAEASSLVPPDLRVISSESFDVVSQVKINYTVIAVEVLPSASLVAVCTELAVLFVDARTWREVGRLGLDSLGDTASCAHWDTFATRLVIGTRSGKLFTAVLPRWIARSSSWTPPGAELLVGIAQTAVQRMHSNIAEGLLFAVTARGAIHCFDTIAAEPRHTMQCGSYGMHLVTSTVYNAHAQYLLCGGEATFLLAWIAPTLANQVPIRIEDNVCPHASRVMGVSSDPETAMISSLDNRGILKLWDLQTLQCTQTRKLAMTQNDFVALLMMPRSLIVFLQKETFAFSVDSEKLEMPVVSLRCNPKGGSVAGAVCRDIIEWSSTNGRKQQHLQNVMDHAIVATCYVGRTGAVVALNRAGEIGLFAMSTKKSLGFYDHKVLRAEGVAVNFCPVARRIIVPTVDNSVWFLPTSITASEYPVRCSLAASDTSCTCLATGAVDGVPTYFVGTTEGSINFFIFRHPNRPKLVGRVELQSEGEQVTALAFSDSENLICADTGGAISIVRPAKSKVVFRAKLHDIAGGDSCDEDAFVTVLTSCVAGAVFIAGSSAGTVHILHYSKRHAPKVLVQWQAHTEPLTAVVVEQHAILTTTDRGAMTAWTMDGAKLIHFWGPERSVKEIVAPRPLWMDAVEARLSHVEGTALDLSASFATPVLRMTRVISRLSAFMSPTSKQKSQQEKLAPAAEADEPALSTNSRVLGNDEGADESEVAGSLRRADSMLLPLLEGADAPQARRQKAKRASLMGAMATVVSTTEEEEEEERGARNTRHRRVSLLAVAATPDGTGDRAVASISGADDRGCEAVSNRKGGASRVPPRAFGSFRAKPRDEVQLAPLQSTVIWKREEERVASAAEAQMPGGARRPRSLISMSHCLGLPPVAKAHAGQSTASSAAGSDNDDDSRHDDTRFASGSFCGTHGSFLSFEDVSEEEAAAQRRARARTRHSISLRKAPVVSRR